jgi:hypothetical protein
MKRRDIKLHVSDHAVLRYLERGHGLDIDAVRRHLAGLAFNGAQLGAVAVRVEEVRLFLRENDIGEGRKLVTVATVGTPAMRLVDPGGAERADG